MALALIEAHRDYKVFGMYEIVKIIFLNAAKRTHVCRKLVSLMQGYLFKQVALNNPRHILI